MYSNPVPDRVFSRTNLGLGCAKALLHAIKGLGERWAGFPCQARFKILFHSAREQRIVQSVQEIQCGNHGALRALL
jgi:hypothetical protein